MTVRPSPIAGTWYTDNAHTLTQQLGHYLAQAHPPPSTGKLWGVVVPHAGYRYSGAVAAHAFKCLHGAQPKLIAVLSPMHHPAQAALLTSGHSAYQTPLGQVEVDRKMINKLDQALHQRLGLGLTAVYHDREHALEIELPFLQHIVGPFRLLPIMLSNQQAALVKTLGETLADVLAGTQAILVASSDLSHFYPQQTACQLDAELLRRVGRFDPQAVLDAETEGVGFACGRGAIAAVLWATQKLGANQVHILHHATSGDATGDVEAVVGYGAAAIYQTE